jgi:hypothetical protein
MKKIHIVLSFILLIAACKKDQLSDDTSILSYSVTDLNRHSFILDNVIIDESNLTISLLFNNRIRADSLLLSFTSTLSLPAGAESLPASGETITLSMDELSKQTIIAEDGSEVDYIIILRDNQIPNAGFEDWYTQSGLNAQPYEEYTLGI